MDNPYLPFQPTLTELALKRHGLSLRSMPACSMLSGAVHSYLQINASRATPYPVIPDGTHAIYISPSGAFLVGAQSTAMDIDLLKPGEYFGIRFFPGKLRHFIDVNVSEIRDARVSAADFSWLNFMHLSEKVYQHSRFEDRISVCEQWLLECFQANVSNKFDYAMDLIYQASGNIKINRLSALVGWSSRHLNRVFSLHTGFSTKEFSQIIRIQNTCKQLWLHQRRSTNTVNDFGFFDQSHLIKQWNKHFLSSPGALWSRLMSDSYNP
ncbi:helix-turn-helix domain-containing protein [Methylobacter sp. YRD-M1]|uniref:helix-turn-helix domain-containing protein n=1 Tax=Methylobacter sp. YRD-M1 TaxID=2911520 RepID=UPI00227B3FF6|nr:helix-turn-helix domain-containing protein [Methylobacter sp. YRD-M1]WAK04530.1 helix-turn-helix domain-containing protein [Methylobacter sp. YRD-M1]